MKVFMFCFLLMVIPFRAFSQEMVKINVLALADKVPAPPADVKAAYMRLECVEVNMAQRCSAEKFYQPTEAELTAVKLQLEKLNLALAMPASSGMQDMSPEEIQKKLAAMSPEEQMEFAMQMSGSQRLRPEPDEVLAAIEEHGELGAQISMDIQNPGGMLQKRFFLMRERDDKHRDIDAWFRAEYDKLPQVSFGEAGRGPEPKAEYALRVAAMDKHIAAENQYLQALQTFWPEYRGHLQAEYGPFQEKLAAINYGEDALNRENKRILAGGQSLLFTPADDLLAFSREATEAAANWWLQKLELEQKKPQS